MRFLSTLIICIVIAVTSFGQTTTWLGGTNSDWNNASNWSNNVPVAGGLAVVIAGINDPVISVDLNVDFQIENFTTLTLNADVEISAVFTNFGSGIIINNGTLTNNLAQLINNNGTIINENHIINNGTFQSNGSGILENKTLAVFDNNTGAGVNNFAALNNLGIFNNDGSTTNLNTIDNAGTFNNNGPLTQGVNGFFNNLPGGIFNNNNNINNSGDFNNAGSLINLGNIQNNSNGVFNNDGSLINNINFINAGILNNTNSLVNNSNFTNDFGANLINTGSIINSSCSTFKQFSANPIFPAFINNGILYQIAGAGTVTVSGGTGVVLNDINALPSPTANCQDIIVVLDENGGVSIEPLDIDNNSSAGYCSIVDYQINIDTFTCLNVGPNVVTLTITDDLGFLGFCNSTVTVVDGTAPVISDCPSDITLNLDGGECEVIYNFSAPTADDICGATVIKTDNSGLDSGDAFPIGTTTIEYQATDGTNIAYCSFNITVNEFPDPSTSLTCNTLSQVSLDQNCEAYIGADDLLEGGPYGCYNNYDVDIFYDLEMTQPLPTSPLVTSQNIDDTLIVMVTDPSTSNSCWGSIVVKDYIAPVIICEDLTIDCLQDSSPDAIGYPVSYDNCDNGIFPLYYDTKTGGGCEDEIITRHWTVTDASGNSSSCEQTITIVRPDFELTVFPPNLDNIDEPALDCSGNPGTHPDQTGWPTINGHSIQNICEFAAAYDDQIIPICDGTYKIIRSWEVYDWCESKGKWHDQIIKVIDTEGPVLTCPGNIEIETNPNSCIASFILPLPGIEDECSSTTTTTITTSAGEIYNGVLTNLPPGIHTVSYWVTDDCGNESNCSFEVTVIDLTPPVAVCESVHTISLTLDEPTLVAALVFDDGSYDNCSGITYEIRRMDAPLCPGNDATPFASNVPFYCCDVGSIVMVELKVIDAGGNSNSCMVEVTVEDNLNPAIQCPPDVTLDCYGDYTDLSITGEAIATDNCSYILTHVDQGDIDNCGGGQINRIWTATDPGGRTASCVQKIFIINDGPFHINDTECNNADPNDGVIWPCDYETNGCAADTDPAIAGEPQIFEDGCDLVSVTYEDIVLPITPPACIKIIRVWSIYDWCQYDQATGAGVWHYNQIIKVLNTEAPEFTSGCEEDNFCGYEPNCGDVAVVLTASATDDCTAEEDLNFNYEIDLGNDGTVEVSGSGNTVNGSYPLGAHSIKWFVEDGCGNVNTCEKTFVISDCKLPTPYCINGLAIEIMPFVNAIQVAATDFDQGSYDNCGIGEFLIASPSGGPGQNLPPATASETIVFDCDDIGTQTVDLWVSDVFGNWDYCSTYIIIQDNMGSCPNQADAQIAGAIENEAGEMVESVIVLLDGFAPGIPDPNITGVDGNYGFPQLPMGYDYVVQPEKDEYPMNGVSTFDLLLIKKHILGIESLNSPYKMIAADINASGSISTFDLVQLRRLILQVDLDFTSNTSWRFVDADFVFPNPSNPFSSPFPEISEVADLAGDVNSNFVAVKIGDVNNSAATNDFNGGGEARNMEDPLIFTIRDELLNPGRTYQVDFTAADINSMIGYQFTLDYDQDLLEFHNIIPGALDELSLNNFGLSKINEGSITTSWNKGNNYTELDQDEVLFSLVFEAKQQVSWSEAISVSSQFTQAEAYNTDKEIVNVQLEFNGANVISNKFNMYPNQPNPFADETLISFSLPQATPLNFTIQDVSGKIIKTIDMEAGVGYNEIVIARNDLTGPGVYFYTLKTKTHRVSQRMVLKE